MFRDRVLLFSRCGLEHTEHCPASEEIWNDVLAAGRVVLEPTSGIQTLTAVVHGAPRARENNIPAEIISHTSRRNKPCQMFGLGPRQGLGWNGEPRPALRAVPLRLPDRAIEEIDRCGQHRGEIHRVGPRFAS